MSPNVIILAGGHGTRMAKLNNNIPKVFQPICGIPMIEIIISKLLIAGIKEFNIIIVVSPETYTYAKEHLKYKQIQLTIQSVSNGSAGAVIACTPLITDLDWYLILSGDGPLIDSEFIKKMIQLQQPRMAVCNVMDPTGFGRVVTNESHVIDIIEQKDCNEEQNKIKTVNTSMYFVNGKMLKYALSKITNNNKANEYYLTDIVKNYPLVPMFQQNEYEAYNVNTPENLSEAEKLYVQYG